MTYPLTGSSDLQADQGIQIASIALVRPARISEAQLAAAERTRLYHVNKLAVYRASSAAVIAQKAAPDAMGVQAP